MALAGVGAGINELTALAATAELAPTAKRGKYVAVLIFTIIPFVSTYPLPPSRKRINPRKVPLRSLGAIDRIPRLMALHWTSLRSLGIVSI